MHWLMADPSLQRHRKKSTFSKLFAQLPRIGQVPSLDMDSFDKNDPVWKLLEQGSQKKASPYFVRKVLRSVREDARREPAFSWRLALRWLMPVTACAVLVVAWPILHQENTSTTMASTEFNEYFDSAADLDSLVISEDISNWVASN